MKKIFVIASWLTLTVLSACGFHLPNQTKIGQAIPTLNVEGDYHHPFYKLVVRKLKQSGVNVISQRSDFTPDTSNKDIPLLLIPKPYVQIPVVSVDSKGQALESNLNVAVNATLKIGTHTPIIMHNSITRSLIEKTGQPLAAENQEKILTLETYDELASQLVLRLSYLGKLSDPDTKSISPRDLLESEGEIYNDYPTNLTLIDMLKVQDENEKAQGKTVTLDEINNLDTVLQKDVKLPRKKVELLHEAPKDSDF